MENDLLGKKIGRWTILEKINKITKQNKNLVYYICRCECGTIREVIRQSIINGKSQSCGCLNREIISNRPAHNRKKFGESASYRTLRNYKYAAKNREIKWNITDELALFLFSQACYYCGKQPSNIMKGVYGHFAYNGIDRLNNDKGYEQDNVVSCCWVCNEAKKKMGYNEFFAWISRIYTKKTTTKCDYAIDNDDDNVVIIKTYAFPEK